MINMGKTALQFSGGKDSLACLYLLRDHLDNITVYHVDTGDKYPETREVVDAVKTWVPNFVTVQSDVKSWIAENGHPSDLVPTTTSELGRLMGFGKARLSDRFSCCFNNLMLPMYRRMKADGIEVIIRGTKLVDMPKVPCRSGSDVDGFRFYHPIEDWTNEQVFSYLESVGAPVAKFYKHLVGAPDCPSCTAWWSEGRAAYLKKEHPETYRHYIGVLTEIRKEVTPLFEALNSELTNEV